MSEPSSEREYVLGTHDEELARLGFQHQVWRAQACAIWELAGFAPGHRLLDMGCGPGFTTLDLADLVGPAGHVCAVDMSQRYVDHLRAQAALRGVRHITASVGDVQSLGLAEGSLDGAYTRWVLCFVPDPAAVIAGVARALRPGAAFAIQDYSYYRGMTLAPRSDAFDRVIRAVDESWRARGGDPDIGRRLPGLLDAGGFRVRELRPLVRLARPGSLLWQWPETFFRIFVPTLVANGFLTADEQSAFERDWGARSSDPAAFFVTPQMIDLVAIRR